MPRLMSPRVFLYVLFLLILDMAFSPALQIGDTRPIFGYLFIPYAAFHWGWQKTLPAALLIGLSRDLVSTLPFGVELVSLFAVSLALDIIAQKMDRRSTLIRLLSTFLFVFVVNLAVLVVCSFISHAVGLRWYNVAICLGSALYATAIMPLFAIVTAWWFHERLFLKQYELFR
ncbi:MAG: hypothetical protein Q8R76_06460 [Candidatus Omnitrophota bacterium]|nr:hypothetical protein [Candidatus Omnitrophota bacterium]